MPIRLTVVSVIGMGLSLLQAGCVCACCSGIQAHPSGAPAGGVMMYSEAEIYTTGVPRPPSTDIVSNEILIPAGVEGTTSAPPPTLPPSGRDVLWGLDETTRILRHTSSEIERAFAALEGAARHGEPSFRSGRWLESDVCPLGVLTLRKRIAGTTSSNIFVADIINGTDPRGLGISVIVKHANDCRSLLDAAGDVGLHPLLVDAVYLSTLASTGLVPVPLYLSPATMIPKVGSLPERVTTKVIAQERDRCAREKTDTRFVVLEKMGVELGSYLRHLGKTAPWRVMAHRAVSLTIKVIYMLETIHDLGIVHGDIHGKNILFRTPYDKVEDVPMEEMALSFIDFEFAVFYPHEVGTQVEKTKLSRISRRMLSPWHLQGIRIGRRDDVYRALQLLADVLSMGAYYEKLDKKISWLRLTIAHDLYLAEVKAPTNLFNDISPDISDEGLASSIRRHLNQIASEHLDTLTHPDDRPEYHRIVTLLEAVQRILSSTR